MFRQSKSLIYLSISAFAFLLLQWSCKKKDVFPSQQLPEINSVSPASAKARTLITIKGANLKNVTDVKFGNKEAAGFNASANTDTAVNVTVPDSLPLGNLYIQVYLADGKGYSAFPFTVLLTPPVPKIDSVSPSTAFPGNLVTVYGTNFTLVNSVKLAGMDASFAHTLDTNGKMTVIIPANAPGGNQFITLANVNGADSVAFNVNLAPIISGVAPGSGKVGDVITVTGVRLNNITSVKLGALVVTYTSVNSTSLTFTVPVGALNGNITVTNALGTATSPQTFLIVAPIVSYVFQDAIVANFQISSYTATTTISTTNPETGTNSLYTAYAGGYGAFRLSDYQAASTFIDLTPYSTLRFSIYGGPGTNGQKISVAVNNNYSNTVQVILSEGSYTDYFIPLSSLGNPTVLNEIVLQEFSGNAATTIYVDNIGLN
jgi:hypothetical protein